MQSFAPIVRGMPQQRGGHAAAWLAALVAGCGAAGPQPEPSPAKADEPAAVTELAARQPAGTPELVLQAGHAGFVSHIAWHPQADTLASGGSDGSVRLWDARTGVARGVLEGHSAGVLLAWSPDGETLASGGNDAWVRVWDAHTGAQQREISSMPPPRALSWRPDGEMLAWSTAGSVCLWDAGSGEDHSCVEGHTDLVSALAWSPDGETLASGGDDHTVRLWNAQTREARAVLEGHADSVSALAWRPDGETLASGSDDHTARLWNAPAGELRAVLEGHADAVTSLAWSPGGETLASAGSDATARLWSAPAGELRAVLEGHDDTVSSLGWRPDGETLASGSDDHTVRLWNVPDGGQARAVLEGHGKPLWQVAWQPNGERLASAGADGTVRLWEGASGEAGPVLGGHARWVRAIAWSPDGETLASGGSDGRVHLRDVRTGNTQAVLEGGSDDVVALAWHPDGERLASGSRDGRMRLWDARTEDPIEVLDGHGGAIATVAWSPGGDILASSSDDETVRLWDARTGETREVLQSPDEPGALAWSPDGDTLAVDSADGMVRLWDARSGEQRTAREEHALDLAWSPDGETLAVAVTSQVQLQDPDTGEARETLVGHSMGAGLVSSVAWSPDGEMLASGSWDDTVRLWNARTGESIRTLATHSGDVLQLAWSPDGDAVAASTAGGAILLFRVSDGATVMLRGGAEDDAGRALVHTADGLYVGDEQDAEQVWFRLGGDLLASPLVNADQLFYSFYRPKLMDGFWAGRPIALPPELREGVGAPPTVTLHEVPERPGERIRVTVRAAPRLGGGVRGVTLLLDGRKVPPAGPGRRQDDGLVREFELRLPKGPSRLRGVAYSALGRVRAESEEVTVTRPGDPPARRRLHLLSASVDRYADPTLRLRFRARDGRRIAQMFAQQRGRAFAEVHVTRLCDGERSHRERGCDGPATRRRVRAELARLAREATPEDVVAIHLTGHGETHRCEGEEEPRFRFLASGVSLRRPGTMCTESLSVDELSEAFTAIPARHELLLLDACKSGASEQGAAGERRALRNLSYFDGLPVLTAAARGAASQEIEALESSLFTTALLQAAERATTDGEGAATIAALAEHLERRLPRLAEQHTGRAQRPVVRRGAGDFVVLR